jgi:hypothetical protein
MIFLSYLTSCSRQPTTDLCAIFQWEHCGGNSRHSHRSSAQSVPSLGAAAQFNPANISHERGLGLELLYQPSQPVAFNFVAGTGKSGAALVSSRIENSFFGNRLPELDSDYLTRRRESIQYKSKKQVIAFGVALHKSAKAGLDLGIIAKYNPDTSQVNPGVGLSAKWRFLSVGASLYSDTYRLEFQNKRRWNDGILYQDIFQNESFTERITVQTLTAGIQIKNLFLDYGQVETSYQFYNNEKQIIKFYSGSLIIGKWLLSGAQRIEESSAPDFDGENLEFGVLKKDIFASLQYSISNNIVIMTQYNYFLLRELSMGITIFI